MNADRGRKVAAALHEHYLVHDHNEADVDGNLPCRCGDWREPDSAMDDENDWEAHLADVAISALGETVDLVLTTLYRGAEETVSRVVDLYETWRDAGPPPLGVSTARWWDTRLIELRDAIGGKA